MVKRANIPEVRFNPISLEYKPLPEKPKYNFQIPTYIHERSQAKKRNVSAFFDSLVQSIRTGTDSRGYELDVEDPGYYGVGVDTFSPDVLKLYDLGPEYTEVKVAQFRRGNFLCARNQLARGYKLLMERLEQGDELPGFNYAFIRYGTHDDYELHHCLRDGKKNGTGIHRCDNKCLTTNATNKIRDVSIVPFNLLLGIFSSSEFHRERPMNHSSSTGRDYEHYIHLATSLCSVFHGHARKAPAKTIEDVIQDSIDSDLRDLLMLDSFEIVRTLSPKNLTCQPVGMDKYAIRQFPIVRFEIGKDAEEEWLRNFKRYNGKLLTRCIGEVQEEIEF